LALFPARAQHQRIRSNQTGLRRTVDGRQPAVARLSTVRAASLIQHCLAQSPPLHCAPDETSA